MNDPILEDVFDSPQISTRNGERAAFLGDTVFDKWKPGVSVKVEILADFDQKLPFEDPFLSACEDNAGAGWTASSFEADLNGATANVCEVRYGASSAVPVATTIISWFTQGIQTHITFSEGHLGATNADTPASGQELLQAVSGWAFDPAK